MKTARIVVVAALLLSLAVEIVPGLLHPYSWQNAAIDIVALIAFIGPAVGFFFGIRFWQVALGVVCVLGALLWGAFPFIPTDIDRERFDLYIWAFGEVLLIAAAIAGFSAKKRAPNQVPEPTSGLAPGRGSS